jgi:hypothetical protein
VPSGVIVAAMVRSLRASDDLRGRRVEVSAATRP